MLLKHHIWILLFATYVAVSLSLQSCADIQVDNKELAINELMAKNQSGLLASDGKLHDWIEIINHADYATNLQGYILQKDSGKVRWVFPDTVLESGQCLLVYATKDSLRDNMSCGFKLASKNETIELVTPHGIVISTMSYDKLKADQSLKLTKKNKLKKTVKPTPGFTNDDEGYEYYIQLLESQRQGALRLWEYLDKNPVFSERNSKPRWFELKNTSDKTINLKEYGLTDDIDSPSRLPLPGDTLGPGGIILVIDKEKLIKGNTVILTKNGKLADALSSNKTYPGVSVGKLNDDYRTYFFSSPTPNAENTTHAYKDVTKKPDFKPLHGAYKKEEMRICIDTHGMTVHYTTDGNRPTKESKIYKDCIVIDSTTTIRAYSEYDSLVPSKEVVSTYILGVEHTLPVVNITIKESDLYDTHHGIYAKGTGASKEFPYLGANFWKGWEKPAHIEFCDGKEGFSYDCGILIFGGYSRANDKKSFRIKFHSCYGKGNLDYDIYNKGDDKEYGSIILRSGSQDDIGVMVRDEFFTSLMSPHCPTLHVQAYRPVVLYMNGKYFGIYYIREKINDEFICNHMNVAPGTSDLLMQQYEPLVGTSKYYRKLVNYAIRKDTRKDDVFKVLKDSIDFMSLIDFKLGEFYASNTDAGNIRYFRSNDPGCDRKWHWIYYDLDASFYCIQPLKFYIRGNTLNSPVSSINAYNVLINRLLRNPEFRALFLERWAYHRKYTFSPENATKVFDDLVNTIKPEMERNCKRWPNMSYKTWEKHVDKFRQQLTDRLPVLHEDLLHELDVTKEEKKKYFGE